MSNNIRARLGRLSTAALCDAAGTHGFAPVRLTRLSGEGTVCGPAVTVECAEGSVRPFADALALFRAGDVLCATAPGPMAYLGDLLATELRRRGAAAAVIDGQVRDRQRLEQVGVSVFARGVTPRAAHGKAAGRVQVPVTVDETVVNPGDWIVADDDGVIVLGIDLVAELVNRAEALEQRDARIVEAMRNGQSLFDAWAQEQSTEAP